MAHSPKVSVILPVYNGAAYLEGCLRSILGQTFLDFELLVGDDGSTDETPRILDAVKDPRVKRLYPGNAPGLFRNLNRLVLASRGELVRIFCQDDVMNPECLAETVRFHAEHPGLGMSYCKYHFIDENGQSLGDGGALGDVPAVLRPRLALQQFLYHGCLPGNLSSVCVPRASFDRVGLFAEDQIICGDYEMWVRICTELPLGVQHQYLLQLRRHSAQLSRISGSGTRYIAEAIDIRRGLLARLPEEMRPAALRYERWRHHVNHFNHWWRLMFAGRRDEARTLARAMGEGNLLRASLRWLLTLNNRIYLPGAPWVLTPEEVAEHRVERQRANQH